MNLLKRVASERSTIVVMVTHDSEMAEQADVKLRLVNGQLQQV